MQRRSIVYINALVLRLDRFDVSLDKIGAREARQPPQIDMTGIKIVMTGDQPRQHARIGRVGSARDERELETQRGPHAKVFEYGHVTVAAARQHQMTAHGRCGIIHALECAMRTPLAIMLGTRVYRRAGTTARPTDLPPRRASALRTRNDGRRLLITCLPPP